MNNRYTALWHLSSTASSLVEKEFTSEAGDCLIQNKFSMISMGTERLVASGAVPKKIGDAMAVPGMEGTFELPVKYGYSVVGSVIEGPETFIGKEVHYMYPHQDLVRIPSSALSIIPEGIPLSRAVLASNMETAVNAIWDSEVSIGDRVGVLGFGLIGSLVARLLQQIPGIELIIIEKNAYRASLAKEMGFVLMGKEEMQKADGMDMVFHTSATEEGLQTAIDLVGFEGKVVELSWYGSQKISLDLGSGFHSERKKIICSQVGHIPGNRQYRWDYHRRKQLVFSLLEDHRWDLHLTHTIPFSESAQFFNQVRSSTPEGLSWTIKY